MTAQYWILGFPVSHSLSPAMHNAAFAALDIDARYATHAVEPAKLPAAIDELRSLGIAGANVTVPHKEAVIALLDAVDPAARAIGAVNTIVRDGAKLRGYNTDAPGLCASLLEAGVTLRGSRVVILGAGGAARAAIVGLGQAGAAEVVVAARRADRAQALAAELSAAAGTLVRGVDMDAGLRQALPTTTLLVQGTSATLISDPNAQALADSIPIELLPAAAVVIDLVYKPRVTTLMRRAHQRGLKTVDGLGMLLHQGAIAFEHWTSRKPPLSVMRAALEAGLS